MAWTMSIALGNPVRRSVAKFKSDPVPEEAVLKAVEGKFLWQCVSEFRLSSIQ